MSNCNCPGICSDLPVAEINCLYRLFDRVNNCEIYKVAKTLNDLINDCLATEVGRASSDNLVYRRGRGLVIKIEDDVSVLFTHVGEVIIDDLGISLDLPNVNNCDTNEEIPRLSYEFLESIAQRLTTCPPSSDPTIPDPSPAPRPDPDNEQEFPIVENP